MSKKIINKKRGITLVEVVLSAAILSLFLGSVITVYVSFIKDSANYQSSLKGYYLLEEGLESLKSMRDNSWTNITSLTEGTDYYLLWSGSEWQATLTPQSTDGYIRTFSTENAYRDANGDFASSGTVDDDAREVTLTVSWLGRTSTTTKSTSSYITNIFDN